MRVLRAIAVAVPLLLAGVAAAIACTSADPEVSQDRLDCAWVTQQPGNCWVQFVEGVDRCLGQFDGGVVTTGVLAADRMSCTYVDGGRIVTGAQPLDEPQEGIEAGVLDADEQTTKRSFVVKLPSGQTCLAFDQSPGSAVAVGPDGSVKWSNDGQRLTITCPDGRTISAANGDLLECLNPTQLPGYAFRNTDASAFFALNGMTGPVYACQIPDAAAAPDG